MDLKFICEKVFEKIAKYYFPCKWKWYKRY